MWGKRIGSVSKKKKQALKYGCQSLIKAFRIGLELAESGECRVPRAQIAGFSTLESGMDV